MADETKVKKKEGSSNTGLIIGGVIVLVLIVGGIAAYLSSIGEEEVVEDVYEPSYTPTPVVVNDEGDDEPSYGAPPGVDCGDDGLVNDLPPECYPINAELNGKCGPSNGFQRCKGAEYCGANGKCGTYEEYKYPQYQEYSGPDSAYHSAAIDTGKCGGAHNNQKCFTDQVCNIDGECGPWDTHAFDANAQYAGPDSNYNKANPPPPTMVDPVTGELYEETNRQLVKKNNGSVSCQTYCAGTNGGPWNNELPAEWGGAKCVSSPIEGQTCTTVKGSPTECLCEKDPSNPWHGVTDAVGSSEVPNSSGNVVNISIKVYEHVGYKGAEIINITMGTNSSGYRNGDVIASGNLSRNDVASSAKVRGPVILRLYQHADYKGPYIDIHGNREIRDFTIKGGGMNYNDQFSSYRVYYMGRVQSPLGDLKIMSDKDLNKVWDYNYDTGYLTIHDYHGGNNQKFDYNAATGEIKERRDGKCVDIQGGGYPSNQKRIILHPCHGGWNQKWAMHSSNDEKRPMFCSVMSGSDGKAYCIDLAEGKTNNGSKLWMWEHQPSNINQKWKVSDQEIKFRRRKRRRRR